MVSIMPHPMSGAVRRKESSFLRSLPCTEYDQTVPMQAELTKMGRALFSRVSREITAYRRTAIPHSQKAGLYPVIGLQKAPASGTFLRPGSLPSVTTIELFRYKHLYRSFLPGLCPIFVLKEMRGHRRPFFRPMARNGGFPPVLDGWEIGCGARPAFFLLPGAKTAGLPGIGGDAGIGIIPWMNYL
jgi:hypothetical protein